MNKPIKAIIIDDEPLARKVIHNYIEKIPFLEIIASLGDPVAALAIIRKHKPDVLFLDINMPELTGIQLIHALSEVPKIIFTTAYPEFAVEGFELEALDYLVKPFSFERFLKAVNRLAETENHTEKDFLFIKEGKKFYKLSYSNILFLEAYGDYVKIHTKEKLILVKERLQHYETVLPAGQFCRVHRSFIVSVTNINYLEGNRLKVDQHFLPISQKYKELVMARFFE